MMICDHKFVKPEVIKITLDCEDIAFLYFDQNSKNHNLDTCIYNCVCHIRQFLLLVCLVYIIKRPDS